MSEHFDPYYTWLAIPPAEQPPNHYRLLGITVFEIDPTVIANAAEQRMVYLRTFQLGKNSAMSEKLLNDMAAAKICLLNAGTKAAYDAYLRHQGSGKRKRRRSLSVPVLLTGGVALVVVVIALLVTASQHPPAVPNVAMQPAKASPSPIPAKPTEQQQPRTDAVATIAREKKPAASPPAPMSKPAQPQPPQPVMTTLATTPASTPVVAAAPPPVPSPVPAVAAAPAPAPAPIAKPQVAPVAVDTRMPIPSEADQQQALKMVQDLYKTEFEQARTAENKRSLSQKMLHEASKLKGPDRYVLFQSALELAVKVDDQKLAFEAIDRMAEAFEIDPWELKASILSPWTKRAHKQPERKAFAQECLALLQKALADNSFTAAEQLGKLALSEASKAKEKELVGQARSGLKHVQESSKAFSDVAGAMATLKEKPDDPKANLAVGRYRCLMADDWTKGLRNLAKGSDAGLEALAEQELAADVPQSDRLPDAQKLGDAWWDLAQEAEDRERDSMLVRAGYWYQQVGEASELLRAKLDKRMAVIARLGRPIPAADRRTILVNSIGMRLVLIPAGEFMMGSSDEDVAWAMKEGKQVCDPRNVAYPTSFIPGETPRHRVRISRPFYLGIYEVMQVEYEQVVGTNPSVFSTKGKWAVGQDTRRFPVDSVSWEDATSFCQKLSALPAERAARRIYRLPTEAEWEYACRADTNSRWYRGDALDDLEAIAWYCKAVPADGSAGNHAVGGKKPNDFGLYDMHGDVSEWCSDWWDAGYYRQSPVIDPQGPATGSERAIRGGSRFGAGVFCRSASRSGHKPSYRNGTIGFRVVAIYQ